MNTVNFNVAKKDFETISSIADRAVYIASKAGDHLDRTEIEMDLCAAHNTCPLKLGELLAADDFNFAHDVFGIRRHLDRGTGELKDFFSPRFSA